jgi:sugar O-acyltransferase (sialic acid O-acetyltransferase NeuD family)
VRVVVIGGGGHGSVVIDILEKLPQFTLVGIVDSNLDRGTRILGYEVLGPPESIAEIVHDHSIQGVLIAVGDNWTRSRLFHTVQTAVPTIQFPTAIHPSALIGKDVSIGQGTVIMAGAIVNCNSSIGDFCILNTRCSLDHNTKIGDFASFAPKSCTGGGATIGNFSAICIGTNVIDRITIGEHTVIGAGSTVLHDQPSCIVAYGTPARKTNDRQPGDRYL